MNVTPSDVYLGCGGLGKATFINSLFDQVILPPREEAPLDVNEDLLKPVPIQCIAYHHGM